MYWPDRGSGVDVEPDRKPVVSAVRQFFTEGGPGVPPTVPGGDWFNQITNELLNVLAAAGIDPSKTDDDQLLQAINGISKAMSAREAQRRTYAEAGFNLVPGSFELGGTVTTATDVLLYEADGKAYSFSGTLPHTVDGDSAPADEPGMWTDRSGVLLRGTVYGKFLSLSLYYTLADDWSDPAINTQRIESVCTLAASKGAQVDMDLPLEISITGLTAAARDTKKFSTCGCSLRTTAASSFYPVVDYRNHFGAVTLPFTARFAPASFVKTPYAIESTLNFNTLLTKAAGSKTYYVVGTALAPVGGGDGLTMKTGFSQLQMALNMPDCGEIVLPAGYYNKEESGFIAAAINRKIIIRSIGGKAIFSCSNKALVWTQLGTSTVYQRTMALTTRLIDKKFTQVVNLKNGLFDDHFELTKVTTLAECQATPGTFHVDGANLVSVRLLDDRVPDDSLICFRDVQYVVNDSNSQSVIVLDGIIFEGWGVGPRFVGDGVLYARNCQFNYTSTPAADGGLMMKGWRSYTERCGASRNANDGFNYHANGASKSDAQEFQCFAYRNGSYVYGSMPTNKNASTIHDGCQIVRADCYYDGSLGPVVADVHASTVSYNLGVVSLNSVMPNPDNQTERAYEFTGGAVGYLDACVGAGSQWALLTDASSGVFVRQSALYGTLFGGDVVRQF